MSSALNPVSHMDVADIAASAVAISQLTDVASASTCDSRRDQSVISEWTTPMIIDNVHIHSDDWSARGEHRFVRIPGSKSWNLKTDAITRFFNENHPISTTGSTNWIMGSNRLRLPEKHSAEIRCSCFGKPLQGEARVRDLARIRKRPRDDESHEAPQSRRNIRKKPQDHSTSVASDAVPQHPTRVTMSKRCGCTCRITIKFDADLFGGDLFIDRNRTRMQHCNVRGQHPPPNSSDHPVIRSLTTAQKEEFGWLSYNLRAAPSAIALHISEQNGGANVSTSAISAASQYAAVTEEKILVDRAIQRIASMIDANSGMSPQELLFFGCPSSNEIDKLIVLLRVHCILDDLRFIVELSSPKFTSSEFRALPVWQNFVKFMNDTVGSTQPILDVANPNVVGSLYNFSALGQSDIGLTLTSDAFLQLVRNPKSAQDMHVHHFFDSASSTSCQSDSHSQDGTTHDVCPPQFFVDPSSVEQSGGDEFSLSQLSQESSQAVVSSMRHRFQQINRSHSSTGTRNSGSDPITTITWSKRLKPLPRNEIFTTLMKMQRVRAFGTCSGNLSMYEYLPDVTQSTSAAASASHSCSRVGPIDVSHSVSAFCRIFMSNSHPIESLHPNHVADERSLQYGILDSQRRRAVAEFLHHGKIQSHDIIEANIVQNDHSLANIMNFLERFNSHSLMAAALPILLSIRSFPTPISVVPSASDSIHIATTIDLVLCTPINPTQPTSDSINNRPLFHWSLFDIRFESECPALRSNSRDVTELAAWIKHASSIVPTIAPRSIRSTSSLLRAEPYWAKLQPYPVSKIAGDCLHANLNALSFRTELQRIGAPGPWSVDVIILFSMGRGVEASRFSLAEKHLIIPDHVLLHIIRATHSTIELVSQFCRRVGLPRSLVHFGFSWKQSRDEFEAEPTVLMIDATALTNNLKRPLLIATGTNSDGHSFSAAYAVVSSETQDAHHWFAQTCLPSILSPSALRAVHVVITDGKNEQIVAIESAKSNRIFHENCRRLACCWHKIELWGDRNLKALFKRESDYEKILRLLRAMYKQCETDAEVNALFDYIAKLVDPRQSGHSDDRILSQRAYDTLKGRLQTLRGSHDWARPLRIRVRSKGINTTGRSEGENSALKGGKRHSVNAATKLHDLVKVTYQLLRSRDNRDGVDISFTNARREVVSDARLHDAEGTLTKYSYRIFKKEMTESQHYDVTFDPIVRNEWSVRRRLDDDPDSISSDDDVNSVGSDESECDGSTISSDDDSDGTVSSEDDDDGTISSEDESGSSVSSEEDDDSSDGDDHDSSITSEDGSILSRADPQIALRSGGRLPIRTRKVRLLSDANKVPFLACSCHYFVFMLLPCRHVLAVKNRQVCAAEDFHFSWTRSHRDAIFSVRRPRSFGDGIRGPGIFGVEACQISLASLSVIQNYQCISFDLDQRDADDVADSLVGFIDDDMAADVSDRDALKTVTVRYRAMREYLLKLGAKFCDDASLLTPTQFRAAQRLVDAHMRAMHASLLKDFGDGETVHSRVKTGVGGRKSVRL